MQPSAVCNGHNGGPAKHAVETKGLLPLACLQSGRLQSRRVKL